MSDSTRPPPTVAPWRQRLYEIIFEADTPAGKAFDVVVLVLIVVSVLAVMLESVRPIDEAYHRELRALEWTITGLFTLEYGLRLICARRPTRYARSFFGVIDLLAIVPTYLSLFLAGTQGLMVVRALRLLRAFRVFKLARYLQESQQLMRALRASMRKILVFLFAVVTIVIIVGTLMYVIESPTNPAFSSIPRGVYWAIVTLTTVGFGDITPQSVVGQVLASVVMIMGYGIIAVPTGIVSVEIARAARARPRICPACTLSGHESDARFCRGCGGDLAEIGQ
ncbi:MAG: ion transporter [Phycisphaeraceae bacterium]|nr:ion transporter [Phycisphaeraceae bacterium]